MRVSTTGILKLPVETIEQIIECGVEVHDLYALRATCKPLCALVTPGAFHSIQMINTVNSSLAFAKMCRCQTIAPHIREVRFVETSEASYITWSVVKTILSALPWIRLLPCLQALTFVFDPFPSLANRTMTGPGHQGSIVQAISDVSHLLKSPRALKSLTLENVIPYAGAVSFSPSFYALFESITTFRFSCVSENPHSGRGAGLSYWSRYIGNLLHLPALARNLTSLSLSSDRDIPLSFRDLTYPHLSSLALESILFAPSFGTEDFILRHSSTLKHLELLSCKIVIPEGDTVPRRAWGDMWDGFSVDMTALTSVQVQASVVGFTYSRLVASGYIDQMIAGSEEEQALSRFEAIVRGRGQSSSRCSQ
ncbi:hypothetical protein BV25DRAFT_1233240 [Artomyces pyxidatus]|uniref:Uncharacterized protein n=1 Tax=Artomyces pyxidatus TaxID=48021 RepID=A0ACB8SPN6_9AGAM|nr:hypothetical protein BV25DRAFT_1233240 [Artomyces pyxidatus]